jgi:hypothetical protein
MLREGGCSYCFLDDRLLLLALEMAMVLKAQGLEHCVLVASTWGLILMQAEILAFFPVVPRAGRKD